MRSRIGLTWRAPDGRRRRSPGPGPRPPSRRPARTRWRASRPPARPAGASRSARTRRRARRARRSGTVEPDAVVAHVERHDVAHVRQRQAGARPRRRAWRRSRAPPGPSAAARPRSRDGGRSGSPVDGDLDRDAVELRPLARDLARAPRAAIAVSSAAGSDASTDRRASVRLSRASRSAFARWRSLVASGRSLRLVGGLELGDDRRSGPGRSCRGSRAPSAAARPARPPRAPGSAAGRGARRSPSSAASSRATAWRAARSARRPARRRPCRRR